MRRVLMVLTVLVLAIGGWWLWTTQPHVRATLEQYVENGDFQTLEARYTAEQLMDKHRKELLEDDRYTFQEPILKFYPYLLLDVKYVQADKKTREGEILWCLTDAEMVLDTETWEKTHGFEDALNAGATRQDFKVMQALAKSGSLTREQLQKDLRLEADTVAPWIQSTLDKHLVVQTEGELQLHFQNPKLLVTPQTKIKQAFVSKSNFQAQRISKKYSRSEIEKVALAAFGPSFTIRSIKEVYLPVYFIGVLNPDGSVYTTQWNAISGQQI